MNTKMKQIALPMVVVITVLLAFSSPAAADYSGDKPLTIYEQDTINGGLIYETVTDGSAYTALYARFYRGDQGFEKPSDFWVNLTQPIEITGIPEGATVKVARLYNYYTWSTSDWDFPGVIGLPAEADMWFEGHKVTCQNPLPEGCTGCCPPVECRDALPNHIDYGNGVIQYWDAKGQNYTGKTWDFVDGTFAWDVTDMVTGNGIYTAKITNNDSSPSGIRSGQGLYPNPRVRERFCTFGFALLVVYEHPDSPVIGYGIAEGGDLLWNLFGVTNEDATASATFGGISGGTDANLTTVVGYSDEGWKTPPENMIIFNDYEIGPSTAGGIEHIGVNYFNATALLSPGENVVEFQARGDGECVWNAFLVVEGGEWAIPANVTFDKKKLKLNSSGILKAFITLPEGYNVTDINVSTVTCEGTCEGTCDGAPALVGGGVIPGKQALEVKFKIPDLKEEGVEPGFDVELTVKGEFMDGTQFEGSNTVGVIV